MQASTSSGHDAAPVTVSIEIPETPLEIEHDAAAAARPGHHRGRVDGSSGTGSAQSSGRLPARLDPNQTRPAFSFSRETDPDGRFRLVVPPGRGTVLLHTFPADFPQPDRGYVGQPPKPEFKRDVEGRRGETIAVADFKLARGPEVGLARGRRRG